MLVAVFICDLIEIAPILIVRYNKVPARVWIENGAQFGALLTCIATTRKAPNIGALALLIALFLYTGVMTFIQPIPL